MLSWSSTEIDEPPAHAAELATFAEVAAGYDDAALAAARDRLVAVAGERFMIDAAAVAANFEMMTRVADGTGARHAPSTAAARNAIGAELGITDFTSAR